MKEDREGAVNNLKGQVRAFFDKCNEGGYGAQDRNMESCLRFAEYLGNNTNLQKMKNAEARHLYGYVEFMQNRGLATSTIMTDLSGIRFYYDRNGCKNELPTNDKLNLGKRETGKYDRAWLPSEIDRCYALANLKGRMDVVISMDFMLHFGLRIDEATSLKLTYLKRALNYGELMVTGKGGKQRVITFAQNYLTELSYMKPKDAKLKVSRALGHERMEITRVYISDKKSLIDLLK